MPSITALEPVRVIEGGRLVHETLREQTAVNRIKSYLSV